MKIGLKASLSMGNVTASAANPAAADPPPPADLPGESQKGNVSQKGV